MSFEHMIHTYTHWRQSALNSAGALQGGDGEFSPHFILKIFGEGIKVVVHVLQRHQLVWRH